MVKRIAFVWAWDRAKEIFPDWRDGLRTAIEIIGQTYDVDWILGEEPADDYDFILVWSDQNAPILQQKYKSPMGLCYGSTFPPDIEKLKNLKVVYAENSITYDLLRRGGLRVIRAFGTDTDFFSPVKHEYNDQLTRDCCSICGGSRGSHVKDIPYFYPATFSPWKRQGSIAHTFGKYLACVGEVQPDGQAEYQACIDNGVHVIGQYTPSRIVRDLYRRSQMVIIPALYGSERTVLEAMSNDIKPMVADENDRATTYMKEFKKSKMKSPREFVKKFYSAEIYAKQLIKGIEE